MVKVNNRPIVRGKFAQSRVDVMITIFCDFQLFWAKNWRFSQKPMLWSKFCIFYVALFWVKNANFFCIFRPLVTLIRILDGRFSSWLFASRKYRYECVCNLAIEIEQVCLHWSCKNFWGNPPCKNRLISTLDKTAYVIGTRFREIRYTTQNRVEISWKNSAGLLCWWGCPECINWISRLFGAIVTSPWKGTHI
jgi:hypothetical protein